MKLQDGARFCSRCGNVIAGNGVPPMPAMYLGANGPIPKKKKGKGCLTAFLVFLFLLLAAAAGGGALYYYNKKNDEVLLESIRAEYREDGEDEEAEPEGEEPEGEEADEGKADEGEAEDGEAGTKEDEAERPAASETLATEAATMPEAWPAAVTTAGATTAANAAATAPDSSEPVVLYASQVDFSNYRKAAVLKNTVSESSHVTQNSNIDYTGWSAFDGQITTSWQEGAAGDGAGEYVQAAFDREYQVQMVTVRLGNHRSDSWYQKNNTPKSLIIELGSQRFSVDFPQEKEEFAVLLPQPAEASDIRVTVGEVYPGTEYDDATIAEIGVYEA
ncbi:MAG: hypothetical protein Q4F29_13475 [Lachnospiraceae bacterium]|nr:hypothetical protein [Lachnospiraceae bacterium]